MNSRSLFANTISWIFGIAVLSIALLNLLWGNDQGFGIFLLILSFIFFPPINAFLKKRFDISIPVLVKIGLGVFILWASLGVGELFDKIEMMTRDLM